HANEPGRPWPPMLRSKRGCWFAVRAVAVGGATIWASRTAIIPSTAMSAVVRNLRENPRSADISTSPHTRVHSGPRSAGHLRFNLAFPAAGVIPELGHIAGGDR